MFLLKDSPITIEQYNKSYDWLIENGFSPSINIDDEEINEIEDSYSMPSKYAIDIINRYGSMEAFKEVYKKCQCNYNFNNDIFCGFRGIIISKKDISEYQKLQYALMIKDILSIDISEFEYNTGKYLDIDGFEKMITTLPEKEQKVIRYYYPLDEKKYTLVEIGDMLGSSKQRISQIKKDAIKRLNFPFRRKHIVRDYQNDYREIEEYNTEINNLKSEVEDLQIINEYFLNTENTELSELKVDTNKLEKLRKQNIINIQDLIQKYCNTEMSVVEIIDNFGYYEDLEFSSRTYNCLRRWSKIRTLYDLVNSTEYDIRKIRTLGQNSYNEIIDKMSAKGLTLKKENGEITPNYFIIEKNARLKKLEDINNKKDNLENNIKRYYKAVEQYLNNEDIFNSEYNVSAINLKKENFESLDNIKTLLDDLKIISNDNAKEDKSNVQTNKNVKL